MVISRLYLTVAVGCCGGFVLGFEYNDNAHTLSEPTSLIE